MILYRPPSIFANFEFVQKLLRKMKNISIFSFYWSSIKTFKQIQNKFQINSKEEKKQTSAHRAILLNDIRLPVSKLTEGLKHQNVLLSEFPKILFRLYIFFVFNFTILLSSYPCPHILYVWERRYATVNMLFRVDIYIISNGSVCNCSLM